jgi:hypothetical protein
MFSKFIGGLLFLLLSLKCAVYGRFGSNALGVKFRHHPEMGSKARNISYFIPLEINEEFKNN